MIFSKIQSLFEILKLINRKKWMMFATANTFLHASSSAFFKAFASHLFTLIGLVEISFVATYNHNGNLVLMLSNIELTVSLIFTKSEKTKEK